MRRGGRLTEYNKSRYSLEPTNMLVGGEHGCQDDYFDAVEAVEDIIENGCNLI